MIRAVKSSVVICFICCCPAPGQTQQIGVEIGKIIRNEANIDFDVVPGLLVGVIDGDSMYVSSFGEPIDREAIFELGSATKPFVAFLADKALDSLGWTRTESVCSFLPDSLCVGDWNKVTIEQLLDHRSGLLRLPPGMGEIETDVRDPYRDYSVALFASDVRSMDPVPGKYSYSHVGYAMLAWLFEKVGGLESFAGMIWNGQLHFDHTRFVAEDQEITPGHGFDGRVQPVWHTNALAPAIGLKSNMDDLLRWIKYLMPRLALKEPILTSDLKREMNGLSKAGAYSVVDGWFMIPSGSSLLYYHNGRTGGHHVSIAFVPKLRKGVVVLSNGALGSNELSLLVLDMLRRAKIKKN